MNGHASHTTKLLLYSPLTLLAPWTLEQQHTAFQVQSSPHRVHISGRGQLTSRLYRGAAATADVAALVKPANVLAIDRYLQTSSFIFDDCRSPEGLCAELRFRVAQKTQDTPPIHTTHKQRRTFNPQRHKVVTNGSNTSKSSLCFRLIREKLFV
ncbi:hypothetical protein BDD12DRAFT_335192 [Trichophaea hybrida]|nr:hypothetical protein BDD12DRAFT_335192 [Trichophaea hybrida]